MSTILLCIGCAAAYTTLILLLVRGSHPRGKSDKVLEAEMDAQLQRLRERGGL